MRPDELGDRLQAALGPRFEVGELLGSGGFAHVYKARDHRLEIEVAVKVLRPETWSEVVRERFLREARTVAKLRHPNVIPIYNVDEGNGLMWLVMPFIEGGTLRELSAPMEPEKVRTILIEIAEGLRTAHEAGIVHRDLKPENVLLDHGRVVITDFGIAKPLAPDSVVTVSGAVIGTPRYMPPEQARGEEVDGRSDIYALGCVGYELLCGRPPFDGDTPGVLIARHLSETPADLGDGDVAEAVMRCLEKVPADRWSDAASLASCLSLPLSKRVARPESSAAYNTVAVHWPRIGLGLLGVAVVVGLLVGDTGISFGSYALAWFVAAGGFWFLFDKAEKSVSPGKRREFSHLLRSARSGTGLGTVPAQFGMVFDRVFGVWPPERRELGLLNLRSFLRSCAASYLAYVSILSLGFAVSSNESVRSVMGIPEPILVLVLVGLLVWLLVGILSLLSRLPKTRSWNVLARVLSVTAVLATMMGVAILLPQGGGVQTAQKAVGIIVLVNFIPDFVSLAETRWAIRLMDEHAGRAPIILGFDALFTATISWMALAPFALWTMAGSGAASIPAQISGAASWLLALAVGPDLTGLNPQTAPDPMLRTAFYSAFFTSVWLWLYILAWMLSRALVHMRDGVGFLLRATDVERQPFRSLGFATVVVTTGLFLLGLPLVLL